ncbi:MAG: hypothetical protein ACI965_000030 [Paraglaciecola sp.]|jgi:hypothetical protein
MALVLSAAVLKSGLVVSIILLHIFIGNMTHFQIKPEENALEMIFAEVRNIPYINHRLDAGYRIKARDDRCD